MRIPGPKQSSGAAGGCPALTFTDLQNTTKHSLISSKISIDNTAAAACVTTTMQEGLIPTWLLLLGGAALTYTLLRRWTTLDLFKIPSPWGLPWTGQLLQLALNAYRPHELFLQWHEALGGIVRLRIFHRDVIIIADPQVAAQVLAKGKNECYRRAPEYATYDVVSSSSITPTQRLQWDSMGWWVVGWWCSSGSKARRL